MNKLTINNQLLKKLRQGHSSAYEKVYKDNFNVIYKLVIVNSGSLEDAQDLMQDTLVVVIKNIRNPDFTLTSSLSTYLYAIANNIWLMELKRRKKNKDVPPKMLVLEEDNSLK